MTYYWLKAGHIIFVIFWMAGLFMLPRLFVYHQECPADSSENGKWIERERRLIRIILNPSLAVVWALGLLLAWQTHAMAYGWFHAKLLFALIVIGLHHVIGARAKKMAAGDADAGPTKVLGIVLAVCGALAAFVAVWRFGK